MIKLIKKRVPHIKGAIRYNEPLSNHTSFRIGGAADVWIEPEDIKTSVRFCRKKSIPLYIIGEGTNLLVRDEGIRGVVINMRAPRLKHIVPTEGDLVATSSVLLRELLRYAISHGLSGLEFLSGIPGTVGGALISNAGARDCEERNTWHCIGDVIGEATVMDLAGETHYLNRERLAFSYRSLNIENDIILEAKFLLTKASKEGILKRCQEYIDQKKSSQDLTSPSAGCIFKNPSGIKETAGELIERCDLKGATVGGAQVSGRHANYIINTGSACAADVLELMRIIRSKVKATFGIELSPEIRIV